MVVGFKKAYMTYINPKLLRSMRSAAARSCACYQTLWGDFKVS